MSDHSGPEISVILAEDARVIIQWRSSFGSRDSSSRFDGNVSEPLDSTLEGFSCNSRRAWWHEGIQLFFQVPQFSDNMRFICSLASSIILCNSFRRARSGIRWIVGVSIDPKTVSACSYSAC